MVIDPVISDVEDLLADRMPAIATEDASKWGVQEADGSLELGWSSARLLRVISTGFAQVYAIML